MNRLIQLLLVVVWIAGAVLGGITEPPPDASTDPRELSRLIETRHAQVQITPDHVVLRITTPWQSEWRVAAPLPAALTPNRPANQSRSQANAPDPVLPPLIRSLSSLP